MIKISAFVGERIKSLRKSKGLTQANLGEQVDLPQPYIGGIEKGERNISLETLQKLIEALDVTPAELFRHFENELPNKEMFEILDRINEVLSQRNIEEIRIVENFIYDLLKTIDKLKISS
ncbi:helix-turn-helix domain-containing protein [Paenibacillus xylanilyticus]|uniref:Helix-turn-helix transcriptional regulator n=1 Tax=Paenibacillus xylanilyticus TaxID=248903 RepID=A0A7Y6EVF6_9BACL|nr:helix-turn-helix transcriptional regulator [Paenibacillus xylanilyticus]NUU75385.1 helix-turn-helix transcriptional regulator [Paenibacillus xylanilyticus]